ncbi:uncharacterized protein LOC123872284 [Maniola jurtina]|uniref:uncharacterized protein LOC123872284 n=1 Tax=Maniola jurtina TaxID=191418 RepID=UPI001E686ABE|nr:uncharacterized protein LOC123872284 [Maniola jurtina]
MEEELSENELEGRMYAMIHYVDETQANIGLDQKEIKIVDNVQHSGLRRYWHNTIEQKTPYQKINTPKEPVKAPETKNVLDTSQHKKNESVSSSPDLSIFQQPVPNNIRKTVEILENEDLNRVFELVSSDEDEVIEVALPPKPTITIESSDEDTVAISISSAEKKAIEKQQESKTGNREVTSSPVPSVVSSVSDEFIRGDCIALNISSKHANSQSFDFSLHGADLLGQTPTRKKKKKRNKDTSTPNITPVNSTPIPVDECFATPKSKAKNKKQRTKSYRVSEKSIPDPDVYDSDSNQSTNEGNKNPNPISIPDKSLPVTDVNESDQSNQLEVIKDTSVVVNVDQEAENNSVSTESSITTTPKATKKNTDTLITKNNTSNKSVIDLTKPDENNITIDENIVMGNVSGFSELDSYDENTPTHDDPPKCGSTKIPAILNEDLDFDNLKGNNRVCKRRRYSLTTLRAEMEKFYNESWGGEDFNHREIQKNMSRDKSLWVIDPKDRMSSLTKRKITCNYCNRVGHRDDTCRLKPPVCFMCGSTGHYEPRCPRKICVNCGTPNHMYSRMCRNCSNWGTIQCAECGQNGHPSSHCPDLWRRYHNTINLDMPLTENHQLKKHHQIYCSGCTRRGHLIHNCRVTLPFSGLPINSPYVAVYRPVYSPICNNSLSINNPNQGNKQYKRNVTQDPNLSSESTPRNQQLKRHSKSPVNHDTHLNKKKNLGTSGGTEIRQSTKSPINNSNSLQKKNSQNKEQPAITNKDTTETNKNAETALAEENEATDKAPDFIPITSENHDKQGQIIQDNEVSDTSDVVTSARIYIPKEIVEKLKTEEGGTWMKEAIKKNNVTLESDIITFYISIKGTVGNQEAFQTELRDWISTKQNKERAVSESEADVTQESITDQSLMSNDIPKNRNNVLRKLNKAFETLKTDLGDPKTLYRELVYLQNRHEQLLKGKAISPQKLSNNRSNINGMLRKLNMVLIGQAGLADGSRHLSELHLLHEKLTNFRQKNIPTTLREEIGQHFHYIFTAIPRDDYVELLNKYYFSRPAPALKTKHNNKVFKSPMVTQKNNINIQHLQRSVNNANGDNNRHLNTSIATPLMTNAKRKLMFYHRRLLSTKPRDMVLKKTKTELINKINSQITSFEKKSYASKKNFKKMKKVQEQVQLFLSNIYNIQMIDFSMGFVRNMSGLLVLFLFFTGISARRYPDEDFYPGNYYNQQQERVNAALEKLETAKSPQYVQNWPNITMKLGQVSAVDIDKAGHTLVLHRGANAWDATTFSMRNIYQFIGDPPIAAPTVLVFNETGELVDSWGQNLFHMPHGITADKEGNVWVTDVALHQVFKFTPQSRTQPALVLGEKFVPGDDDYHFCKPAAVAVLSSGDFFVADGYCNSRVIKFARDGSKILQWGKRFGDSPFVFSVPHALALAEDRNELCVANRERGRVECFRADSGAYTTSFHNWLVGPKIYSVAYAPLEGGRLYIVNGPSLPDIPSRGYVIDYTSGRLIQTFAPTDGFHNPHDIAVKPDGSAIYVAELDPRRVTKFVHVTVRNDTREQAVNVTHAKPTATVEGHGPLTAGAGEGVGVSGVLSDVGDAWAMWGGAVGGALAAAGGTLLVALCRARNSGRKSVTRRRWEYGHGEFKLRRLLERRRFTRVRSDDSEDEPAPMLPPPTA